MPKPAPAPPPRVTAASRVGEPLIKPVAYKPVTSASAVANPAFAGTSQSAVTITGCLESTIDGDQFRLTDTEGAAAPRARGWRSAFLMKRPAPVQLVASSDRLALRKYVGQRVTATGLLADREMRLRSFESAGPSCD